MARSRKQGRVRLIGVARRTRSSLMVSTALQAVVVMVLTVPADAQPAPNAQPMGGVVIGGSASISQTANNTAINQASRRAAIDWQSFNVGSQQSVTFQQPNAQSIALNTVTGPNPSQIAGRITANGQVVLVNQSGVTFYKGSQVNTAGLMVSAASADPKAFMAGGNVVFNQAGDPNARIVNNGNITIRGAGLAALVAPGVANAGTITAKLGHVVLAGAKTTTLDLYGDKLVSVNVTGAVTQAPDGTEALVTNTGVVRADGGTVQLTARAVDGVVTNLVSAGGKIQANTVGSRQGKITIDGVGGSITITGGLDATGRAAGSKGGQIGLLSTDAVIVKSGAVVNASGAAGGGTIAIGTTLKRAAGGAAVTHAKLAKGVLIQQGATIEANATGNGDGGRVTVLSSQLTAVEGTISAMGGAAGGNGGFVEVSGGVLSLTGAVDLAAPSGLVGTLLLDPTNLDVVDNSPAGTNIDNEFTVVANNGTLAFLAADAGTTPSSITAAEINTLGSAGNVTIQATGSIEFQNNRTAISIANDLTVQAGADLLVNRSVHISTTGNLSLTSGADTTTGIATNTGSIALGTTGEGGPVSLSAAALVVNGGSTGINLDNASISVTGLTNLNALGGGVTQVAAGALRTGTLASSAGITGTVSLGGTANAISTLGSLAVSGGDFNLVDTGNLSVSGPLTANNVALNSASITATGSIGAATIAALASGAGGIALNSGQILSGATVDLSAAGGGVTQVATGTIATSAVLQSGSGVSGTVTLAGTANTIASVGSFAVTGGDFNLLAAGNLSVSGPLTATNVTLSNANTGTISVAGSVGATTTVKLSSGSGGIQLNTGHILSAATVDLSTTGGGVTQVATGTIAASKVLQSSSGVVGSVSLAGTKNAIASVGNFAVTGGSNGFALFNGAPLTVAGTVTAPGNIYLESSDRGGVTIGVTGSVGAGVDSLVSVQADAFSVATNGTIGNGTISGGTFELAPDTSDTSITLGFGNYLGLLTGIGPANVRIGAVTVPGTGLVTTAGSIRIDGFGTSTVNLELDSLGGITEQTGVALTALTLTGTNAGDVLLTQPNAVSILGSFSTGGSFALNEQPFIGNLTISGPVTAASVAIGNAATITVTGSIGATGLLALSAGAGGIQLNTGEILSGATVDLSATGGGVTQVTTGTIAASTILQSSSGVTGTVDLAGTANAVAAVGSFAVTTGDFVLTDNGNTGNLTISGPVTAANVTIGDANTGTISVSGSVGATGNLILVSGSGGIQLNTGDILSATTVDFSTLGGGVTQVSTGTIVATLLQSSSNVAGTVDLAGNANNIAGLGNFAVTGGDFVLTDAGDAGNLLVGGTVTAINVGLIAGTTGTISLSGSIGATNVALLGGGTGGIQLLGGGILSGSTVDLSTGAGGITQAANSTIIASTVLRSSFGLNGAVDLAGTANAIAALGAFSVTGGAITVRDSTALNVTGPVTAVSEDPVSLTSGGLLTVNAGQTISASDVTLTGTGLVIDGVVADSVSHFTDLVATTGSITESGTIIVGTLIASSAGSIMLTGASASANQITSLGSITAATGTIIINDGTSMSVNGPVTATAGDVVLRAAGPGFTVGILNSGTLSAVSTGTVSIRADNMFIVGAGTVLGGLFEYAQDTVGPLTIGTGGAIVNTDGIGTGAIRLGSAQDAITATSITMASNFDIGFGDGAIPRPLDLQTSGGISDGNFDLLNVTTLTGVATTGSVTLAQTGNFVTTIGTFTAGGTFTLGDSTDLSVTGVLTAPGGVVLGANSITIPGAITIGSNATGIVTLLSTTTIAGTGAITAGTLAATATAINLPGANQIGTAGPLSGTSINLNDGVALIIGNAVSASAGAVTLTSGGLLTLNSGQTITGTGVTLTGSSLAITGLVTTTGTADLIGTSGTILETGTIVAATLIGSVVGDATLSGTVSSNQFANLGSFTSTTGTISLIDRSPLTVIGGVGAAAGDIVLHVTGGGSIDVATTGTLAAAASTGTVSIQSDTFSLTPAGTITGGFFEYTRDSRGSLKVGPGGNIIDLTGIGSGAVGLGSARGLTTALGISLTGSLDLGTGDGGVARPLDLRSVGDIGDGGFAVLNVSTLTGAAKNGSVTLTNPGNTVSAIGAFTAGGSFALIDSVDLTVAGLLQAAPISLNAPNLTITGTINTGGSAVSSTTLVANIGSIDETGTGLIITGILGGSVVSSADLSGTNQIGTLLPLGGTTVNLVDASSLTITNSISVIGTVSVISGGTLTVPAGETVAGSSVSLKGLNLVIDGAVVDPGGGTVNLVSTTGSIVEAANGTIIADTLTGSAVTFASLLQPTNQVGTLGAFATGAGFALVDSQALIVAGPVTDTGVASTLALTTTSGGLTLLGNLSATNAINLVSAGTIGQTGGSIAAASLSGSAITSASLTQPANVIGTLGAFSTTAGFALVNDGALTVTGAVSDTGAATTLSLTTTTGGMTVTGAISATNTLALISAGTIGETGTIAAATLTGSAAGSAILPGASAAANQIATLGSFSAASFTLNNGTVLAVTGGVSGPGGVTIAATGSMTVPGTIVSSAGNIALSDSAAGGISINKGSVIATGQTVSVSAASLGITSPGTISSTTFEFGPGVADGTVTLGGAAFSIGGIGASIIRIGQVNSVVVAGGIVIAGYGNGNRPLELDANGPVTETGALTGVSVLTGTAASYALTKTGNAIAQLGGGTLSTTGGGGIAVADTKALTIAGVVSAGVGTVDISVSGNANLTEAMGATLVAGVLTSANGITGGATLSQVSNQIGTIGNLTAGTGLAVADSQPLTLAGVVKALSGAVDLSTTGLGSNLTQAAGAVLATSTLTSTGGIAGSVSLQGTANAIGTITGLTATGIAVVDAETLTLAGNVSVGAGTVDISGAGVTQAASGALIAGVLTSASSISGSAILQGTANQIGTITGLSAAGLTVVDSEALTLAGLVSTGPSGTMNISTSGGANLTQAPSGTLIAGMLTSTSGISGTAILQGTSNAIGTIVGFTVNGGQLTLVDTEALTLAGIVSAGGTGTVDISVSGGFGVTQGVPGELIAGELTSTGGISGAAILRGAENAIGTIANLTATGLTVVDHVGLTLAGTVSVGPTGTVDISGVSVAQSAGDTLTAAVLTSANGLSGTESLTGTANQIAAITALTAGGLTVVDSEALTLAGKVSAGPAGTLNFSTSGGSNLTEGVGGTLVAGTLTSSGGISGTAILQGVSNAIGTIGGFVATGTLVVVDGIAMTVAGTSGSSAGNVFLTTGSNALSFASGGSLVSQNGGTIAILADSLGAVGSVNAGAAGVFEYAPATSALTVTLGASTGPSLLSAAGITAGLLRIGEVTLSGSLSPTVSAGSIAVAGAFNANGTALELDATGAVTGSAPLLNVATLTGSAASYTLTNPGNTIGQIGGGTLTALAGTIAVVDAAALTIAGTVSAALGNLFISAGTNTIGFTPGGSVVSRAGGTIGLQAGGLANLGTTGATGVVQTTGGLFELAPGGSAGRLTLGASGGLSLVNLTGIGANSLRFGAITMPGTGSPTTTAGSIVIGGTFNANSLPVELDSTGAVTQNAPLLNVATLTGTAASFILNNTGNTIGQIGGGTLTASTGTLAVADSGAMTVAGTIEATAGNVFLETASGTVLTFAPGGVVVSQPGGTIAIEAGGLVNLGTTGATGVVNAGPSGQFQLAPSSTLGLAPETLGSAGLGLSLVNLTGITAGTLLIGEVGAGPETAESISVTGLFDALNRQLILETTGAVAQSAALVNVSTLSGTAMGGVTLTNPGNTIGQIGQTIGLGLNAGSAVAIVDNASLILVGTLSSTAGKVFLETTAGHSLTFAAAGGTIASGFGAMVGIQSDSVINLGTTSATGVVSAGPAGVFELAPVSKIGETLGVGSGLSLTNLTGITAGLVRIGAITLPGSAGPVTTAASIAVGGTFNAGGDALELDARGAVAQSAPLLNVATLTGGAASYTLTNTGNTIGQIGGGTLTASAGTIAVVDAAALTIAGTIGAPASNVFISTGTNAMTFASGGSVVSQATGTIGLLAGSLINLGTTGATGAVLTAGGLLELAPGGSGATLTLGASGGLSLTNLTGIGANSLRFGAVTLPGGTVTTSAASIAIAGVFDANGLPVELDATGAVTQTMPLADVAVLTGSAGSYTLTNPGNSIIQAGGAGGMLTAQLGTIAIVDGTALTLAGVIQATSGNVFVKTEAGNALSFAPFGSVISQPGGTIGIQADSVVNLGITGATSVLNAGVSGLIELAPSSGIGETLGAAFGLSLTNLSNITAGRLRVGAVTLPGGASTTTTATSIMAAGTFNAGGIAVELDATGAVSQTAPLVNVSTLTGTAGSYTLIAAGNSIGQLGGGTLASSGTLAIVDATSLTVAGTVSSSGGDVFLSTGTNGLTLGSGASILSQSGGMIGLQTNVLANVGRTGATGVLNAGAGGVIELAPGSATGETLGVNSGLSLVNLTGVTAGMLRIGAVTMPGGVSTTTSASFISVAGGFGSSSLALELDATGAVTQTAPLTASVLTGTAASYTLINTGNAIAQLGGGTLTATGGTIAVVDNSALTVAGTVQAAAGDVFLQTAAGGQTVTFASGAAVLSRAGGTIGIQTDGLVNLGTTGATGVVSAGAAGLFELAPATTLSTETLGFASGLALTNLTGITTGTLRVGAVTRPGDTAFTVTAGSIDVAGTFNAASITTMDLEAKGTISEAAGAPIINLLNLIENTNGVSGNINLVSTLNSIGTIGAIDVLSGSFTFGDTPAGGTFTVVSGQTISANNVSMTINGTLNVAGSISATAPGGTVSLAAMGGTSDLNLGTGAVVAAGATGTVDLTAGRNLTQTGGVVSGGTVVMTAGALLSIGAEVSAGVADLNGANIAITGTVTTGGTGSIDLIATGGTISETGTLITAALSGSSKGTTALTGAANQVGTVTSFTAASFTLNDAEGLTVTGPIAAGSAFTLTDTGNVVIAAAGSITGTSVGIANTGATTISGLINGDTNAAVIAGQGLIVAAGGTVNATAVSLQGTSITIPGVVEDGPTGSVTLVATAGTIGETGTLLIAGTLFGSSTGATTLTSATNQIANIGSFTAAGFALNDAVSLAVIGPINGGTAAAVDDSASLTIAAGGTVNATAVNLTAATLNIAAGGTVSATAVSLTAGSIAIPGEVTDGGAGTVSLIATGGTISETGTLTAGTLSGSSTGASSLSGAANQIATVSGFSASGFRLNDGTDLSVTGSIAGGGAFVLTDTGNLVIGSAASITGTSVAITDTGSATIAGGVTSNGTGTIITSGTLSIPGIVDTAGGMTISSGGGMTVTGTIASSVGTVGITDSGALSIVGNVTAANGVTIAAGAGMTVTGLIASSAGAVGITDAGALSIVGNVTAGNSVTIASGGNMTVTGLIASSAGTVGITDTGALSLPGLVSGQNGVRITDTGTMTVAGGIVSPGGIVAISDAGGLTVSGTVRAQTGVTGTVTIGDMTLSGLITSATGSIVLGDTGVLSLASTSSIVSQASIAINDPDAVILAGLLDAPRIVVTDTGGAAAILAGTLIETGGQVRHPGTLSASQLPTSTNPGTDGFFMTTDALVQSGTLMVTGLPSVVRIDATGTVKFSSPGGIMAPETWLILGLVDGAKASGAIDVARLDIVFSGRVAGAQLSGLVDGLSGDAASGAANISPSTNATFQINGCPIGSINCVLLTTAGIPAAPPLRDIYIGNIGDPNDADDLLLPLVSDQEY